MLSEREKYWINYYRSYCGFSDCNGYNATLGGEFVEVFTVLNEKELKQFGEDVKNKMSLEDLQEKYQINRRICQDIINGKKWSKYTGIEESPYSKTRSNKITIEQVDLIIKLFKEHGQIQKIADDLQVSRNTISNIVKGITWKDYTKISDDFYTDYICRKGKYRGYQVKEVAKLFIQGKAIKEISKITNVSEKEVRKICNGSNYSDITGFKNKKGPSFNERKTGKKLTEGQVLKIVEMYKKGILQKEIAQKLNISRSCVGDIIRGETWYYLTKDLLND